MDQQLTVFNSLSRQKEIFKPIKEGAVGMYVCGPTVYSSVHLGNCRTFVSFDLIYRYLLHLGLRVRYVRNITDVGHLEGDADRDGEDKISKKARLEQLEPMEVVQQYMNGFHDVMKMLNTLPPSIEPRATGHILEQIEMVQQIIDNGYAYEANGSVYFDTPKFVADKGVYGQLSGRVVDELLSETRDLKNQDEKRHPSDFALWIKADPRHLMRWKAPWSEGFPGWHLECSVMSTKYLGETFDIHGGGNDLKFPHHENEVAQSYGACGHGPSNYWLHTNMLLMNGRKMSKSDGNTISPEELFTGDSPHVSKAYHPTVVRFFMLQTHYRSTLDLSDEALAAAEKGYKRLMEANRHLQAMQLPNGKGDGTLDDDIKKLVSEAYAEMNNDFNSPKALARLFEGLSLINQLHDGKKDIGQLSAESLGSLKKLYADFIFDIFGLEDTNADNSDTGRFDKVMELVLEIRAEARKDKNWTMSDLIRDKLQAAGVVIKDSKDGSHWTFN